MKSPLVAIVAIRREFGDKTKGATYKWLLPDGPPPVPPSGGTR